MRYAVCFILASLLIGENTLAIDNHPSLDILKILVEYDSTQGRRAGWRLEIFNIDEKGQKIGHSYFGENGPTGLSMIALPIEFFSRPSIVYAYFDDYPYFDGDWNDEYQFQEFEIFIPANCGPSAVWKINAITTDLWKHFKEQIANASWNPALSDCGTWLHMIEYLEAQSAYMQPTN